MTKENYELDCRSTCSDPFNDDYEVDSPHKTNKAASENISHGFWILFKFAELADLPIIIFSLSTSCISAASLPLQTLIYGKIFAKLSSYYLNEYSGFREFMKDIRWLCGLIMIIALVNFAVRWLSIYGWLLYGEWQAARIRTKIFNKVMFTSSFEWFDQQKNLIGSITQINRSVEEFREGCSAHVGLLIETIATVIALFIMAMYESWSLTLVVLGTTPIIAVAGWYFGRYIRISSNLENDASSRCSKILDWNFVNNQTIKVFNAKIFEILKLSKVIDESAMAFYKMSNFIAINTGVLKCLTVLMFVQGFWFGNYMISKGNLQINQVFTCFSSCLALGSRLDNITAIFAYLNKAYLAIDRIEKFLETDMNNRLMTDRQRLAVVSSSNGIYPLTCNGAISLTNISFHYNSRPDQKILHNISIIFKPNEFTFIIGESGSGKSTLAQLLLNLYKHTPVEGVVSRINIDGYNLETLNPKWISENITFLQQTPAIFNRTLLENLTIGQEGEIDPQIIVDACSFALLGDFVKTLPNGVDTVVTPLKLSGGQKQRIAIARAYIRDTEVLILDEALSAIDIKNRRELSQSIRKWRKGRTTIFITHDYKQIDQEDYVFEMQKGEVYRHGYLKDLEPKGYSGSSNVLTCEDSSSITIEKEPSIFNEEGPAYLKNPVIIQDLENQTPLLDSVGSESDIPLRSTLFILNYFRKSIEKKYLLAIGLTSSVFLAFCSPVFSYCFAQLLANMVNVSVGGTMYMRDLMVWSCVVITIAIFTGVFQYLSEFILSYISENWIATIRKEAFAKLVEQDSSFYDLDLTNESELTTLIMNDTRDLRNLVSSAIELVINLVVMLLVGIIWSIVSGWKLALVGIAFVPCIILMTSLYSILMQSSEHEYKNKVVDLENHIHDTIYNMKSIIALNLTNSFVQTFDDLLDNVISIGHTRAIKFGVGLTLSTLCISISGATVIYYGMRLAGEFEYTQTQMLRVITLLTMTVANSANLIGQIPHISRGRRAGTYLIRLLELPEANVENSGGLKPYTKLSIKKLAIVDFENVKFGYPTIEAPQKTVLKGVDFKVFSGESVAIVGESGSGKSTIASLLERLYKVSEGDGVISIKGVPINDLDVEWLRSFVSFVPQTPSFFEGTILENLTYGLNGAQISREEIDVSLKRANIYAFVVSLDDGLNTFMGEGLNSMMSGGQLQRLSIARALIRKPKILVMDECTSALDPENSKLINDFVKNELKDGVLTTIVITHSKEMMESCGKVLVVKYGTIVEEGTFKDLFEERGEMYKIIQK